jgi:tripartite-type tricarboxylate transporter receptor subunit TctC
LRSALISCDVTAEDIAMAVKGLLAAIGGFVLLAGASSPGLAQQWPARTVKVVVPYGVGGVTDTMARLTADRLSKALGQAFVIENKGGAGGAIGVDYALNAPQDGYTLLFVGSTLFTVLPLVQKVNYEPLKTLIPVSITGTNGMVMVVSKDAPYATLRELIDYVRANPGKITYSSGGVATNNHLSTAYLAGKEKLDMVHVPFGGGQAALTAVLSKSVDMHFGNSSDLIEPVRSGLVKALAVSTRERMPQMPNVPTVAETVPGYEYVAWNGYAVGGDVPAEIKTTLNAALQPIARDPEVIRIFDRLGIDSTGTTIEQATESIRKDMPVYAQIIELAGLKRR